MRLFLFLFLFHTDSTKFVCGDTVIRNHKQYIIDNVKVRRITKGRNILWKKEVFYKCYRIDRKNDWDWIPENKLRYKINF
jgi:hypothetical protein